MNLGLDSEERMKSLLLSAMDGEATEFQLEQLNEMLRGSEELCRSAARFLCDGSYLSDVIRDIDESDALLQGLQTFGLEILAKEQLPRLGDSRLSPDRSVHAGSIKNLRRPTDVNSHVQATLQFVNHHGLLVAAAAAALLVVFGWQYASMRSNLERLHTLAVRPDPDVQNNSRNRSRDRESGTDVNVARVTGLVNCKWSEGIVPLKFGDRLEAGHRLRLEQGLMQLTFGTGAKVVIEGPADFVVSTPNQATLEHGKIAAVVPRSGRGYTILTPTAEVVDLGTEFGVEVDNAGSSEVHVFDGEVVARSRGGVESEAKLIHAREDEAIQFRAAVEQEGRMKANRFKFARHIIPNRSSEDLPALPVTKNLALWLAADVMPEMKVDAPVTSWPDILIGDNHFPDDAWQFDERRCPTWVRDDRGLPAVRFDGWSTYLATNPMATGDQVTAFVVFAPSPVSFASEFHGGMLLKFGSETPSLEYSLMPDQRVKARVWSKNRAYVGEIQGEPVKSQVLCATAYCYDAVNNHAELFVDGRSAGVADAPGQLQQNRRKYLGAHPEPQWEAYFLGNIYEVIIFDAALDASDRELVYQYLSNRYSIPLVSKR
jgi:hypothetical protein